jgi:NitT/TauT family transport system permease protein
MSAIIDIRAQNERPPKGLFVRAGEYLLSPVLILALWELVARAGWVDTRFFPPPSEVAVTFWGMMQSGEWFRHVGLTLGRVLSGVVTGSVLGVIVGLMMGLSPFVRLVVYPLIGAIFPIPKIAIFPLVLLIFGLGELSKFVTVTLTCFFFLAVNSMVGVLNTPRVFADVGKNFEVGRMRFFLTIALPASLPMIFAGLRLAIGAAFLVVVAVEFVSADGGIGWLIWHSWELFSIKLMFVGLLTVSGLGLALIYGLDMLERVLVPWRQ